MSTLLIIVVLVLLLAGSAPCWPHAKSWGYAPSILWAVLLLMFVAWALGGGRF